MREHKECKNGNNEEKGSTYMLEKALKMSCITNICLIALIAVIVITFQLLVIYETSEFETTYETVTVEEY